MKKINYQKRGSSAKLIDNDEYKLKLKPREFFNIVMEYSSIGSLKEERIKRIITAITLKRRRFHIIYIKYDAE